MNRQEIINKVRELFNFTNEKFELYKTAEGVEFRMDTMAVGTEIYVITPEGELPAPDGEVVLEDGTKVMVKDGVIGELMLPEVSTDEEMAEAELADGTKITNKEGDVDFAEGQMLYVIDAEGNEVMAPEGEHTTKSGIVIVVDGEGKITGVKYPDTEGEGSLEEQSKNKMAQATLIDGTIVETEGDLVVGADLYIITEEGKQPAPTGEHETEDGKIVVVEDGKIVEIKEKEAEVEVEIEMMETFANALEALNNEIKALRQENEELKNKFSKFAAEPAAEKIYDRKGQYVEMLKEQQFSKLEQLAVLRRAIK